jgi:hypothetical protein
MFGTWPKMASIVSERERQNFMIQQKANLLARNRYLQRIKKEGVWLMVVWFGVVCVWFFVCLFV